MTLTPECLARTHAAGFNTGRPWHAAEFAALLAGRGVILSGDARSFLLGRVLAGEAEVLTLVTAPEYRRLGLAHACLQDFLEQAVYQNADVAFLDVSDDNTAAKALYEKEGFAVAGRRQNYYTTADGGHTDAVVMRKPLI